YLRPHRDRDLRRQAEAERNLGVSSKVLPRMLRDVPLAVEFPPRTRPRHVPDLSEDGPLEPWAVKLAGNRPRDSSVTIRIAPIEFVIIVESHRNLERLSGRTGPLEYLLPPIHPHVVVHPPLFDHLNLGGVPQCIVRLGVLQLPLAVENWPMIPGVFCERAHGPGF